MKGMAEEGPEIKAIDKGKILVDGAYNQLPIIFVVILRRK